MVKFLEVGSYIDSKVLAGVIFSIQYNETAGYICSASDDRSAVLWKIKKKKSSVRIAARKYRDRCCLSSSRPLVKNFSMPDP
ncbi:hypothetical protein NQ314_015589 [Rhamnusium bicolor]|uniref:Uncharacterized protein n=1 Tax=Rhamnusium bicolor TaxID=1586634 RepID=A0AAV8WYI8_9CUCU|nr:hypothetical protein NQ314_015589 [Rhamnusium bicolor]